MLYKVWPKWYTSSAFVGGAFTLIWRSSSDALLPYSTPAAHQLKTNAENQRYMYNESSSCWASPSLRERGERHPSKRKQKKKMSKKESRCGYIHISTICISSSVKQHSLYIFDSFIFLVSIHCCVWLRRYPNMRHAQQQKHATTSIRNRKIANKNNKRYRLRKKPLVISAFGKKYNCNSWHAWTWTWKQKYTEI
jgi:hypothetical protein